MICVECAEVFHADATSNDVCSKACLDKWCQDRRLFGEKVVKVSPWLAEARSSAGQVFMWRPGTPKEGDPRLDYYRAKAAVALGRYRDRTSALVDMALALNAVRGSYAPVTYRREGLWFASVWLHKKLTTGPFPSRELAVEMLTASGLRKAVLRRIRRDLRRA